MPKYQYIFDFADIDLTDSSQVGSKAIGLAEIFKAGFPVPAGFVVSSSAYKEFIQQNNLKRVLRDYLRTIGLDHPGQVQEASRHIGHVFAKALIPHDAQKEIVKRYDNMGSLFRRPSVAIRASHLIDNIDKRSSAGEQETYLNIHGESAVLEAVKACWASLYNPRAILSRQARHDYLEVGTSVIVQEMVQSEISGVAFTVNPNGAKHEMVIEAIWGLGELLVDGKVVPDVYHVERHTLELLEKEINPQKMQLVKARLGNKEVRVPAHRNQKEKLDQHKLKVLGNILQKIHAHFYFPQDVEWAFAHGKFYILHIRPQTAIKDKETGTELVNLKVSNVLLQGQGASFGLVTGHVRLVHSVRDLKKVKRGEIVVAKNTSPDFVYTAKHVAGLITDEGGVTSHAAIMARELGIPCVVGTQKATRVLKDGDVVTISGKDGTVAKGRERDTEKDKGQKYIQDVKPRPDIKTATKIYISLAEPSQATEGAKLPVDGIGLLRAEFMIAEIGVHPRQLIAQGRQNQFVEKMAKGIEEFCTAFDPRPVVYRTSDLKTNEYRNLQGGKAYEPEEANPNLGYRGAFRYIADPQVFELELAAIKKVREKYKNLWVMIPFVRTPDELLHVKRIIASQGLYRGPSFKLWMMVELPVNVILIDEFLKVGVDGLSFGSNDLAMLVSGTDRDNESLQSVYNELSPALFWSLKRVIASAKKHRVTTSICGQAASVYDTLVEKLVEMGIDSVSVTPDSLGRVQKVVHETERRISK